MSETEKGFKKFWLNVGAYYGRVIPDEVLKMYSFDSRGVTLKQLSQAFEIYRSGQKAEFFPVPAVLKNIINPPIEKNAEANAAAGLIFEAIRKFGQYASNEVVRDFVGELAWSCIQSMGGWFHVCTNPNLGTDSAVRAQIRDMAISKLTRIEQNRDSQKPGNGVRAFFPDSPQTNENALESDAKVAALASKAVREIPSRGGANG